MKEAAPINPTLINDTVQRLKKEAETAGHNRKHFGTQLKTYMDDAAKLQGKDGDFTHGLAAATAAHLARLRIELLIEMAVYRRIVEVLLAHLKEDRHREAVRALRTLRIEDINL